MTDHRPTLSEAYTSELEIPNMAIKLTVTYQNNWTPTDVVELQDALAEAVSKLADELPEL